ncbi:unnamed protein product [Pylaiella littoralis]
MRTGVVVTGVLVLGKNAQAFVSPLRAGTGTPIPGVCEADNNRCGWTEAARRRSRGVCMATSSELDTSAEYVKAELARVQEEYEVNRKAKMREQTQQAAARGDAAVTPLADLEFIPFLDKDGKLTKLDSKGVKASVFAVYDESKTMRYIGVSRGIQQSLQLILARKPTETYFFKMQSIARPSRSLLEIIKDSWIEENGSTPDGNIDEASQALWESSINTLPMFTEEDKAYVAEMKEKGREHMGIKKVARGIEDEIIKVLEKRGATETFRFDPKLKAKGLLDLTMPKPDTSVPKPWGSAAGATSKVHLCARATPAFMDTDGFDLIHRGEVSLRLGWW